MSGKITKTNKTKQVLQLVAEGGTSYNPLAAAGLMAVNPRREIVSEATPEPFSETFSNADEAEQLISVNLIAIVADELAPLALERFNACSCAKCRKALATHAIKAIAPRYVSCSTNDVYAKNSHSARRQRDFCRLLVARDMVRQIIRRKRLPFH